MVHSTTNDEPLSTADQSMADLCRRFGGIESCSLGLPDEGFAKFEIANDFLFWFPHGCPPGTSVSVASSRLGQKLDEESDWFDALRTLAVQISEHSKFLLTTRGTTTDVFLRRVSELFRIPLLDLIPFPAKAARDWFEQKANSADDTAQQGRSKFVAYFKPLDRAGEAQPTAGVDDLLIGLATSTVLLSVRKNGNIHESTRRRLAQPLQTGTRILINRRLTPKQVESELLELGATAWWLYGKDPADDTGTKANRTSPKKTQSPNAIILTLDEIKTENYLAHWTRRRTGPWPDQPYQEYLDDLIFLAPRRQHGEVAALCRILATGRIVGSHGLTRGRRDVVCFSNLPLDQILDRRVFRPHLSRWDFEPFGIAIDREFLSSLGARPVAYGDESDWTSLDESDQDFFQLRNSKSAEIDWTLEREWRIIGDLNLEDVPVDQAVVFVHSKSDAMLVSQLSRWPVVILDSDS